MKYFIPLIAIFISACTTQIKDQYLINGQISGKTPAKAYLQEYTDGSLVTIDSTEFTNGYFLFEGKVEFPQRYFLKIGNNRPVPFFIENSKLLITGNIDSLNTLNITGSAVNDMYNAFNKETEVFDKQMNEMYDIYRSAEDEVQKTKLDQAMDSLYEAKLDFIKSYVKTNNTCIIAPFLIRTQLVYSSSLTELEELTNMLSPDLKESKYTVQLLKRIDLLRNLQPGMPAPEFSQVNTEGDTINLNDFKGNYLLIDFWASWCGPCRRANPTVVETFKKYNPKGFTILGVSMDNDKSKWLKAIEDDNLTWEHVSTLEGWKNPAGKLYGVNSIPHAVLINPEGKIVKRGIDPYELAATLDSLYMIQ